MLLASVAALALFYLAPTRFGNLIDRLPGETFIRTALVFAPATLFAIVVLAAVGSRGARALIREQLTNIGLREGREFWCVA